MIRLIHQTWRDENPPDPPFRAIWKRSWEELNPNWAYKLWTDEDMANFVAKEFPEFFPVWCAYPKAIMRVDAWRYLALKRLGGVYADLDFACLKPLDEWLPSSELFHCADQGDGWWCNAFMWAPRPELGFFDNIESGLIERCENWDVLEATGPGFLTQYAKKTPDQFALMPTRLIYPLPHWDYARSRKFGDLPLEGVRSEFPEAGAITFWSHSWNGQENSVPTVSAMRSVDDQPCSVLVVVLGLAGNRALRAAARDTWLSRPIEGVTVLFCLGGPAVGTEDENVLAIDGPFEAGILPREIFDAFAADPDAEWLFICEERTYVDLERLKSLVNHRHGLIGNEHLVTKGQPSLGAGFLLSRSAAKLLSAGEMPRKVTSILPELVAAGISWQATHRLRADLRLTPSRNNDLVSAHGCEERGLHLVHTLLYESPIRIAPAAHQNWQDSLMFFGNGFFSKSEGSSCGWWSEEEGGVVILNWFGWAPEVFILMRNENGDYTGSGLVVSRRAADYVCATATTALSEDVSV